MMGGCAGMVRAMSSIRLAGEADLADIARIHVSSWRDAYVSVLPQEILANSVAGGIVRGVAIDAGEVSEQYHCSLL